MSYQEDKLKSLRKPVLLVRYNEERGISADPNEKMIEFRINVVYIDSESGKPQNYTDYDYNDTKYNMDFDDMLIRSVGFTGRDYVDKYGMYNYDVSYHNVYDADLRRVERMVRTLRKIHNKLDKYRQDFGNVDSFDSYLKRVAKSIGCKDIWVIGQKKSSAWGYAAYDYHTYGIEEADAALAKAKAVYASGFSTR